MKFVSLILFQIFLFLSLSASAYNLRGYVFKYNGQSYYTDEATKKSYLLQPANEEVNTALSKLNNMDSLMGTGIMIPENKIYLESVDFVSLRRLIGIWRGPTTIVNFVDYSRVNFQLERGQNSEYRYALAPAEGDNWRIFFTDQSSVVLGSLSIQKSKAQIEVYDSKTGEVYQRYDLRKSPY